MDCMFEMLAALDLRKHVSYAFHRNGITGATLQRGTLLSYIFEMSAALALQSDVSFAFHMSNIEETTPKRGT